LRQQIPTFAADLRIEVMFWDLVSGYYEVFEKLYNGKVNRLMCKNVAERISSSDEVLECACGTGMISVHIAAACKHLTATDFSDGMLDKTRERCRDISNVKVEKGNILQLDYPDESFDKVVAANVIHLLDTPEKALNELFRVCRKGGEVIIPTYLVKQDRGISRLFVRIVNLFGTTFHQQFTEQTYKSFFEKLGYTDGTYDIVDGRMACDIAVFTKQ
jgi:ubiquinone/menaquinone biosynthesis C-methylase UbiE